MADIWILQCRPGFEAECATEAGGEIAADGVVAAPEPAAGAPPLLERIFARQAFQEVACLENLPPGGRINPILAALVPHAGAVNEVLLENPDTEGGKELAGFLKKFALPLKSALAKRGLPVEKGAVRRLHLLFTDSQQVRLGFSHADEGSALPNGILRLKFPHAAPSRSTLKLEEALLSFLTGQEQSKLLRPGLTAVDLGAAPGGWTWQMVQRGLRVTAVDNGPMQAALMDSGLVEHRREDGFRYRPRKSVDWLLCDMVEQPQRIAALMGDWLIAGSCRRALFNLKLPMKKRYDSLQGCLQGLRTRLNAEGFEYRLLCKQLYHDREEVTVFLDVR